VVLRCLPVHCWKDLSDFLVHERPAQGGDHKSVARQMFPCTLFVEDLSAEVAESLVRCVSRIGGWGLRIPFGGGGVSRGDAVLLCCALDRAPALEAEVRGANAGERLAQAVKSMGHHLTRDVPQPIRYHGKTLDFSRGPFLMGVLNVTPDSFYDGGRYLDPEKALDRALQLIEEGADVLDVGGASTRPGSDRVSDERQMERVLPVIRAIRRQWDGWISVDTYSATVAMASVGEGADMINDISAGSMDPDMSGVVARTGVPVILMHMKGTPKVMQQNPSYESLLSDILDAFEEYMRTWETAGVEVGKMLVDPGIGFGKTLEQNLRILRNLEELKILGRPVVLGTSRKSFIGSILGQEVGDRLAGTLATLAVGAMKGAHVFRVHDVAEARDTLSLVQAIRKA
jgi:dihydropteroate synthase